MWGEGGVEEGEGEDGGRDKVRVEYICVVSVKCYHNAPCSLVGVFKDKYDSLIVNWRSAEERMVEGVRRYRLH